MNELHESLKAWNELSAILNHDYFKYLPDMQFKAAWWRVRFECWQALYWQGVKP